MSIAKYYQLSMRLSYKCRDTHVSSIDPDPSLFDEERKKEAKDTERESEPKIRVNKSTVPVLYILFLLLIAEMRRVKSHSSSSSLISLISVQMTISYMCLDVSSSHLSS